MPQHISWLEQQNKEEKSDNFKTQEEGASNPVLLLGKWLKNNKEVALWKSQGLFLGEFYEELSEKFEYELKNLEASHCLKITLNVSFEFLNLGIFHQFCRFKIDLSGNAIWQ